MGQILIRDLDDSVMDLLERRAVLNASSVEEEARAILTANVQLERRAFIERLDAVRTALGPQHEPISSELLREDRARDDQR